MHLHQPTAETPTVILESLLYTRVSHTVENRPFYASLWSSILYTTSSSQGYVLQFWSYCLAKQLGGFPKVQPLKLTITQHTNDENHQSQLIRDIYIYSLSTALCTHPQWYHGGEVEWGDAGTHAQRLPVAVRVHVFCDRTKRLPELKAGDGTTVLYHLQATKDVTLRIRKGFPLFLSDIGRQNILHVYQQTTTKYGKQAMIYTLDLQIKWLLLTSNSCRFNKWRQLPTLQKLNESNTHI